MRVPPTETYPCDTFSAIEQPMKPIEFDWVADACDGRTSAANATAKHAKKVMSTLPKLRIPTSDVNDSSAGSSLLRALPQRRTQLRRCTEGQHSFHSPEGPTILWIDRLLVDDLRELDARV